MSNSNQPPQMSKCFYQPLSDQYAQRSSEVVLRAYIDIYTSKHKAISVGKGQSHVTWSKGLGASYLLCRVSCLNLKPRAITYSVRKCCDSPSDYKYDERKCHVTENFGCD